MCRVQLILMKMVQERELLLGFCSIEMVGYCMHEVHVHRTHGHNKMVDHFITCSKLLYN